MRVNNEQIPEAAIRAAVELMQTHEYFIAGEIREILKEHKVLHTWSAAERLIQRERKAGRIVHHEGRIIEWCWVKPLPGTEGE
ncbi:hypothetical protein [Sporomusa aerivorans]|uniref:hypothetical protein n=1 Tax=Sporomusa aerivorans TaxID=204936 RepID=UPI003529F22D